MITINKEIAEIIRVLRKQWLASDNRPRKRYYRFGYAFLGSFSFFLIIIVDHFGIDIKVISFDPEFIPVGILTTAVVIIPSILFAWLVSWRDSGYGAVRLFLSGLTLPTLTYGIISRVIEF